MRAMLLTSRYACSCDMVAGDVTITWTRKQTLNARFSEPWKEVLLAILDSPCGQARLQGRTRPHVPTAQWGSAGRRDAGGDLCGVGEKCSWLSPFGALTRKTLVGRLHSHLQVGLQLSMRYREGTWVERASLAMKPFSLELWLAWIGMLVGKRVLKSHPGLLALY